MNDAFYFRTAAEVDQIYVPVIFSAFAIHGWLPLSRISQRAIGRIIQYSPLLMNAEKH